MPEPIPLSLVLQWPLPLPLMLVAVFALRIGSERAGSRYHLAAWTLVGVAFTTFTLCLGTQTVFGAVAWFAGKHSAEWADYLRWRPALEHSRTFLMVGTSAALAALAMARAEPGRRFAVAAALLMAAGMAAGAVGGTIEGTLKTLLHLTTVAVLDVVELLVLMGMLFALLVSNRADRYLWALLAVYAASVALGIAWLVVVAPIDTPGAWHPPLWTFSVMRLILYGTMAAIAFRRWRVGRRGRPMRGMLGPERMQISALR
ncbi:MAG TPA: hypothetical protein VF092_17595 [Longimicrobium sp.]